jgi:hypothetical protein
MKSKPLTVPKIIGLYLMPFLIPVIFPFIPIITFSRLNRKGTGWLFSGAEIFVFILLLTLINSVDAQHGDFFYDYALLILVGPVILIHLVSFFTTISLFRRMKARN